MLAEITTDALADSSSEASGKASPEMVPGGFDGRTVRVVVAGVNPRRPRTWSGTSVGA